MRFQISELDYGLQELVRTRVLVRDYEFAGSNHGMKRNSCLNPQNRIVSSLRIVLFVNFNPFITRIAWLLFKVLIIKFG